MTRLQAILRWIASYNKWVGHAMAASCLTLIVLVLADIIGRQLGQYTTQIWEVEWFHLAFLLTIPLGYSIYVGTYVRIDFISIRFSPWIQHLLLFLSFCVIGIPITVLFAWLAWHFFTTSLAMLEVTKGAARLPVYPVKLFIFLGLTLSLPSLIAESIRHLYFVIKKVEL